MNRATTVTILILLLCAIAAQGTQGRCQCPQTSSKMIPLNHIQNLKFIPKGSHCKTLEIIVRHPILDFKGLPFLHQENGNKLCVSTDADWVKIIIKAMKDFHQS
ncbi:interleukin-8-like [Heterodontus francisci]|uniref:interleukin-8-like n=1 Tax=Heterodontus francisci TaxID=7792 RepID=UPI00355B4086